MATQRCRHCGYGVPTDATSCPGCGRADQLGSRGDHGRGPLLRVARWTRRSFVAAGWLATAAAITAVARWGAGRPRFADDVPAETVVGLGDLAYGITLAALGAAVIALAALSTWAGRARRNLGPLGLERRWGSPWSLSGWVAPGHEARRGREAVDARWRDRSPVVASLPGQGWTRHPVSLVVLRWWAPWTGLGALVALGSVAAGGAGRLGAANAFVAVAGGALAVASLRALYDVVGVVTFAQIDRAEHVRAEPVRAEPADPCAPGATSGPTAQSHLPGRAAGAAPSTASASATVGTTA